MAVVARWQARLHRVAVSGVAKDIALPGQFLIRSGHARPARPLPTKT